MSKNNYGPKLTAEEVEDLLEGCDEIGPESSDKVSDMDRALIIEALESERLTYAGLMAIVMSATSLSNNKNDNHRAYRMYLGFAF